MRAIFEVYAKVVDANGTYNTLNGYPKVFDSNSNGGDIAKTRQRAYGEYYDCLGAMCKIDTRKVQFAMLIDASTGMQIEVSKIGYLNTPNSEEDE